MIELRWLIENGGLTKVLQYRNWERTEADIGPEEFYWGWSDWQDVPTVDTVDESIPTHHTSIKGR